MSSDNENTFETSTDSATDSAAAAPDPAPKSTTRRLRSKPLVTGLATVVGVAGVGVAAAAAAQTPPDAQPEPAAAATTPQAAKQFAKRYMKQHYHWDGQQYRDLVQLWNQESGWHYQSTNASSGAYGIPQALPGKKMASEGSDWKTNPETQIKWGLKYIKATYGSPSAALSHEAGAGWY